VAENSLVNKSEFGCIAAVDVGVEMLSWSYI